MTGEGDVIYRLSSIDVAHEIASAGAPLDYAEANQTAGTSNPELRREPQNIVARAAEAAAALVHARSRAANLEVRAPFAGEVRDIPAGLRVGDDIRRGERLGVLVSPMASAVEAYVAEADLDRAQVGAEAHFIVADGPTLPLVVSEVARTSTRSLEVPELASVYEGPIAVRRPDPNGPLIPDLAIYRVLLTGAGGQPLPPTITRRVGEVVIDAPPQSAFMTVYRRAVAVLLREATP